MPSPTSLLVATALVAIPSTAGIYHLATSSSYSKTAEQEGTNKEIPAQELESEKGLARPEIETRQDVEVQPSDTELSEDLSLDSSSLPEKEPKQENPGAVEVVKQILYDIEKIFPYEKIETENEARTDKFEAFVRETDKIRDSVKDISTELFKQKEHETKDIKDLVKDVLGFELINSTSDDELWSRLVQIRKEEASTQADIDWGLNKLSHSPTGDNVTKDNIVNFCLVPSEANSHLGMYDSRREEKEETKEYRLFTYYSYCTKNSFYLDSRLKFVESEN